jgi:hypothetical protein
MRPYVNPIEKNVSTKKNGAGRIRPTQLSWKTRIVPRSLGEIKKTSSAVSKQPVVYQFSGGATAAETTATAAMPKSSPL